MSWQILQGDADPVEFFSAKVERLHAGREMYWSNGGSYVSSSKCCPCFLAFTLETSECDAVLGLASFDMEIGQDSRKERYGLHVGTSPAVKTLATLAIWVFCANRSAEGCRDHIDSFAGYLPDMDSLTIDGRTCILANAHRVSRFLYPDCSVRVENTSNVSKFKVRRHSNILAYRGEVITIYVMENYSGGRA